ncbi:unnamed protein product [Schistosoma margrebowiei]|uniref:Uncharacterized protein n=1 Tax=Schistosoma margrebowiei TaxID=48269 RepID=A0A183M8W0_9TREM|nr:unnamed protein product [Schistosoma margrebowiei]
MVVGGSRQLQFTIPHSTVMKSSDRTNLIEIIFKCKKTIRRNQLSPVVNDNFLKLATGEEITQKLLFKFYGTDVAAIKMRDYAIRYLTWLFHESSAVQSDRFVSVIW